MSLLLVNREDRELSKDIHRLVECVQQMFFSYGAQGCSSIGAGDQTFFC